jgi:hypothetical protein
VRLSPSKLGVAVFEHVDRAQRLQIVLEAAVILHAGVERVLPGVAEGRVTEVVGERDGLGKILVEPSARAMRAGDLGDLDAVREAGAEQVAFVIHEDLGLVFQAPEGRGMHDAVAVALELAARDPRRRRLRRSPAAGACGFAQRRAPVQACATRADRGRTGLQLTARIVGDLRPRRDHRASELPQQHQAQPDRLDLLVVRH